MQIVKGSLDLVENVATGIEETTQIGYFLFFQKKQAVIATVAAGVAIGAALGIAYEIGKWAEKKKYVNLFKDFGDKVCETIDEALEKSTPKQED